MAKAVEKIAEEDIVVMGDRDDTGRASGRKRKRSRSRRRRRSKRSSSDSSSTSATERVRRRQDDASDIIARSEMRTFGQHMFPDAKLVNKVSKHKHRSGERAYLSAVPLEEWVPSYVGDGQQAKVRKEKRLLRSTQGYLTGTQVVEHSVAFWATHGLNGSVSVPALVKHVGILLRMTNEKSVAFAVTYAHKLVSHIRQQWVDKEASECGSFNKFLEMEVTEVVSMVNNALGPVDDSPTDRSKNGAPSGKRPGSRAKNRNWDEEQVNLDKGSKKKKKPRGQKGPKGKGKGNGKSAANQQKQVCIFHHPAENKTCKHGRSCKFDHVDTRIPGQLKRYQQSLVEFDKQRK